MVKEEVKFEPQTWDTTKDDIIIRLSLEPQLEANFIILAHLNIELNKKLEPLIPSYPMRIGKSSLPFNPEIYKHILLLQKALHTPPSTANSFIKVHPQGLTIFFWISFAQEGGGGDDGNFMWSNCA